MNDVGFRQAEDPSASPMSFCDESFYGKNIECFTNGKLRNPELPCPPPLDDFLTGGDSPAQNLIAKPRGQALLQERSRFPVSILTWRFSGGYLPLAYAILAGLFDRVHCFIGMFYHLLYRFRRT